MNRLYKIGNHKVDEYEMERMYHILDELRLYHVYDIQRYVVLTTCMEELTKKSRRLESTGRKEQI